MSERRRLIDGYLERRRTGEIDPGAAGRKTADDIKPHTLIISGFEVATCPETLFGNVRGEIIQHHEIGAFIAPYDSKRSLDPYATLAKLEYAINELGVRHLLVLGNTASCWLSYLLDGTEHEAVAGWIEIAHNAIARARYKAGGEDRETLIREMLHQTVLQSLRNLLTYPVVYNAVKSGDLVLNAWYYCPEEDSLFAYDPDGMHYEKIRSGDSTSSRDGEHQFASAG